MTDVAERRQSTDRRRDSEIPPPHNLEAERAILGAVRVDRRAIDLVADRLTPEQFYRDAHRRIYAAQLALFNRGITIDFLTLKDELSRAKALDEVGYHGWAITEQPGSQTADVEAARDMIQRMGRMFSL